MLLHAYEWSNFLLESCLLVGPNYAIVSVSSGDLHEISLITRIHPIPF